MKQIKPLFFVLIVCALTACKKESGKSGGSGVSPTSEYYFIGTIDGKSVNWEASTGDNGGWAVGSSSALSNYQGEITGGITALLTDYPAEFPQLGIEFKTIDKGPNANETTVFNSFVNTGAWTYASTSAYTVGAKSIVVHYFDSNGNEYSSIGSQSGSSVNILSVTPVSNDSYDITPGVKIKMTFNCTLYSAGGSAEPIALSNGQATVRLEDLIGY